MGSTDHLGVSVVKGRLLAKAPGSELLNASPSLTPLALPGFQVSVFRFQVSVLSSPPASPNHDPLTSNGPTPSDPAPDFHHKGTKTRRLRSGAPQGSRLSSWLPGFRLKKCRALGLRTQESLRVGRSVTSRSSVFKLRRIENPKSKIARAPSPRRGPPATLGFRRRRNLFSSF